MSSLNLDEVDVLAILELVKAFMLKCMTAVQDIFGPHAIEIIVGAVGLTAVFLIIISLFKRLFFRSKTHW